MKKSLSRTCPCCGGGDVARSRIRGVFDYLVTTVLFFVRPYRCMDCWTRFWRVARASGPETKRLSAEGEAISAGVQRSR